MDIAKIYEKCLKTYGKAREPGEKQNRLLSRKWKMEIQLNLKELIQQLKNDEIAVVYRFYIVEES